MKQYVKYTGKTNRFLTKGKCYCVKEFDITNRIYRLDGIDGIFPSYMFEEVAERFVQQKPTYIAFSKTMPKLGDKIFLVRIVGGNIDPVTISPIEDIEYIGGYIYRLETENSIYLTEIKQ